MKEIRSKHKQLKDFVVPQGSCTNGKYFYVIYQRKRPHACKIAQYNINGDLIQISQPLKIGHGNDITYQKGILYITHSAGKKVLHRVEADTLKQIKDIKIITPIKFLKNKIFAFNGITTYKNGFLLRIMNSADMAFVEKKTKKNKSYWVITKLITIDTVHEISQGMESQDTNILRAFSYYQTKQNFIVKYNSQGKQIEIRKAYSENKELIGELESIFLYKNDLYAITYVKNNNKYLTYFCKLNYNFN